MNTPETRAATRDYWSRPNVIRAATVLDWTAGIAFTLALGLIGSLNL